MPLLGILRLWNGENEAVRPMTFQEIFSTFLKCQSDGGVKYLKGLTT